jgi:preprotein translocase subunit SecA
MINKLFQSVFGSRNKRLIKSYQKWVVKINLLESEFEKLSDADLFAKTGEFRARVQKGETLDQLLPEAFAAVREASKRTLGLRHFDVQLIGGMAIHQGKIAEMGTGEGKTLMATLAAYLNTLGGKSVHVVTVNDYLAKRDADWMAPVYRALGLTVGIVIPKLSYVEKKDAYSKDVIYATNNELGFDYLRNKMAYSLEEWTQKELSFAIIDEVDSILIDEARTPLIISGPTDDSSDLYLKIDKIVPQLTCQKDKEGPGDYAIDEKTRQVFLTEEGHHQAENILAQAGLLAPNTKNLYDPANLTLLHHLNASLRAHAVYKRDVDYLVQDDKVVIVDEHTGRTMQGRRWSEGLHQAIEAKEGVAIQSENQTLASITFQNFFRLYDKLSGMTGTADTEAYEFHQIYGLEVVVIPTNRPCQRKDNVDMIYLTKDEKFAAIIDEIKDCIQQQRPALVGTASIETSEYLSDLLQKQNIKHQVLNAKYHAKEAEIIAEAGRAGAITIATNMAGRGTDIVLGGSLEAELKRNPDATPEQIQDLKAEWQKRHDDVVARGGLHILGTERHESRRIDNQLRGRAGRQGDPGSSRFYLSLEDNLMRIFASDKMGGLMRRLGVKQGESITHPWVSRAIENAQRKVEGHNFDIRKQLLEYDNVANDQRTVIYQERDHLLEVENVSDNIQSMINTVMTEVISEYIPPHSLEDQWNISGLELCLESDFQLKLPIQAWLSENTQLHEEPLRQKIIESAHEHYQAQQQLGGQELFQRFEKSVLLNSLDTHWKEHLAAMDYLRQSIGLRGYAQKDPKQEYKREAFNLFTSMLDNLKRAVISTLFRVEVRVKEDVEAIDHVRHEAGERPMDFQHANPSKISDKMMASNDVNEAEVVDFGPKISRNQECPCGSGKKYKYCHGLLDHEQPA